MAPQFSEYVKTALPWVTALATGNVPGLIALAADKISSITGQPVEASPASISTAVEAVEDPAQMVALKQADNELKEHMASLGFTTAAALSSGDTADRSSARQREIAVRDNTPRTIAYSLTIGFFMVLLGLMFVPVPNDNKAVIFTLVGTLGTAWISAMTYYFGHTSSSDYKTTLLAQAQPVDMPKNG